MEGYKGTRVALFYTGNFQGGQTLLHTEAFTHRHFYTQTLLHTRAFTHKSFLHFTQRNFYTQTLLHTEAFTQTLFHTNGF